MKRKESRKTKGFIAKSAASILSTLIFSGLAPSARSATYAYQGKCGFLVLSSFQEKCTALFDDGKLTLMPKGSPQVPVFPQQIVSYSLASKESMKMNENLELWNKVLPAKGFLWWKSKQIPKWVMEATKQKVEQHEFVISYVDRNFQPQIVLFVLDNKSQAAGMGATLQSMSGLSLNQIRKAGEILSPQLARRITKKVQRQSKRLQGLCAASMYDDARPIASALEAYVENTINEVSVFTGIEKVVKDLEQAADSSIAFCNGKKQRDLEKAREAEKVAKQAEIAAEKEQRKAAFDMLGSY